MIPAARARVNGWRRNLNRGGRFQFV